MTSVTDLVNTTREDYLMAGATGRLTKLDGAIANGTADSFDVDDDTQIATGTRICVGFEEMHVWSTSSNTLTVERGMAGSTATAHDDDALVSIAPEYSDAKILRSLQSAVEELRQNPWLFVVSHVDFAPPHDGEFTLGPAPDGSAETGYDGVLEVLIGTTDATEPWARLRSWDVMQTGDTDGSDALVTAPEARFHNATLRVVRRQTLGSLAADTTDVETDVGILNTDLICVLAALRLGVGRPLRRTSLHAQGDTRRANEVAAFSTGNSLRELERRYKALLTAEVTRMKKQYPIRKKNQ